ncbi:beta-glucuronidase-like isoform X1 [Rhagoletis pomonella]|uniref:beta-glucuronidase-like isoform X1 n=1 Tax=Rhagoletis pomonella TaxID=28610 RepID=UPI00177C80C5|nr:beta-glucuronidase-like isoform X1 [Rhagoletis pomonella]
MRIILARTNMIIANKISFINIILAIYWSTGLVTGVSEQPPNISKLGTTNTNAELFDYMRLKDETATRGLLYPRESESREVRTLDGIWRFLRSDVNNPMEGVRNGWYKDDLDKVKPTLPMPVPSSYNDISPDSDLRDHIGTVWYEKKFFVPHSWNTDQRIWLRFGSVHYAAIVWVNGQKVMSHAIGHLPFEAEITGVLKFASENRLTVLCDNTLLNSTIPQGTIVEEENDYGKVIVQQYTFDFFNYAGIHRTVHLYTTPSVYIEEIKVSTDLTQNHVGIVHYEVGVNGNDKKTVIYDPPIDPLYIHAQLRNKEGKIVAHSVSKNAFNGSMIVKDVMPWWPYLMNPEHGYLYTIEIYLHAVDDSLLDVYRMKIGIRTLKWNNSTLLLNDAPIYLRGFGRHEDSDIRGKGLDFALMIRDFNLLKWIGANAYRTSHYPYSEESMQFADEHGFMIINECSGVNADIFDQLLLRNHKSSLEQLIHRDRNHASVVMWSIANEPRSSHSQADNYFKILSNYTKSLDPSRPITAALNVEAKKDKLGQYLDIVSFNRYNAWYQNTGNLDMITKHVEDEATLWHEMHNKPVIMTEYGADTFEGLHSLPAYVWSEEYQRSLLGKHFKAFDNLRSQKWFIGEFLWNFADFKTAQTFTRVGGNKKGIFTRNRQPKSAAYLLRQRYYSLAVELDQCEVPRDIFDYIIHWQEKPPFIRDYDDL